MPARHGRTVARSAHELGNFRFPHQGRRAHGPVGSGLVVAVVPDLGCAVGSNRTDVCPPRQHDHHQCGQRPQRATDRAKPAATDVGARSPGQDRRLPRRAPRWRHLRSRTMQGQCATAPRRSSIGGRSDRPQGRAAQHPVGLEHPVGSGNPGRAVRRPGPRPEPRTAGGDATTLVVVTPAWTRTTRSR